MSQEKEILSQNSRIYYLDAMRGILMILGVFLYSAQVFNPEKSWRIYSGHSDQIVTYIVHSIHFFRMQEFFIISGFFALLTVRKYGPGLFASAHIKRILIPLFVTALMLNMIQMIILSQTGWEMYTFPAYITKGEWVSHL